MTTKPTRVIKKIPSLQHQEAGIHYKGAAIEPIEFCYYNNLGPVESYIIKHIFRHKAKDGLEDLLKAKHYLQMLIEFEYGRAGAEEPTKPVEVFSCKVCNKRFDTPKEVIDHDCHPGHPRS